MARIKISEYKAKKSIFQALGIVWLGTDAFSFTTSEELKRLFQNSPLVVKVDQGIKKRGKQGLVRVNCNSEQVIEFISEKSKLGYEHFLVEKYVHYSEGKEWYLSIERVRDGYHVLVSERGGVEVEEQWDEHVRKFNIPYDIHGEEALKYMHSIDTAQVREMLVKLIELFDRFHFVFLEINPLLVTKQGELMPLDMAVQVDSAALYLPAAAGVGGVIEEMGRSEIEQIVAKLDQNTPASLKFNLINPNGSLWMLLSGGGASLVLADEVADAGWGESLANYGEYSGNPTQEDTFLYTSAVLEGLIRSTAKEKALIIAGGVANFTDVKKTFAGIIQALELKKEILKEQGVKVFVRRGGPNEVSGLALMKKFLEKNELLGLVEGSDLPLTDIVHTALKSLRKS